MLYFKSLSDILTSPQTGDKTLVDLSMSTDTVFCRSLVSAGYLTEQQMLHAAERYRLGRSRDGAVVFWQIDEEQHIRDGKLMWYQDNCHRRKDKDASWVTAILRRQYAIPSGFEPKRCLFGLHLLTQRSLSSRGHISDIIAVVEAEKTAVIMSEHCPKYIWMASGGLSMLNAAKLYPLREHKVVLFPDTDTDGQTYKAWQAIAEAAQENFKYPIRVSDILERSATAEQKEEKIDLVDYLFSNDAICHDEDNAEK